MNHRGYAQAGSALAVVVGVLALAGSASAAVSLKADYRFNDSLSSSVRGAPDLLSTGLGVYSTEIVDGAGDRVLSFPAGGGFTFGAGKLVDRANYSTVFTFRFDDTSSYRRILAFEPLADDSDSGLYNYETELDFYSDNEVEGPPGALAGGEYAEVALTRKANKRVDAYADGQHQLTLNDLLKEAVISGDGLRYFKDNSNAEESAGAVARIRVYDGGLSAADVKAINETGGLRPRAKKAGKPRLTRSGTKSKVSMGIKLRCPDEAVKCSTTAKVTKAKGGKVLGKAKRKLKPGAQKKLKVKLSKHGRKTVNKPGKLRIKTSASVTSASGNRAKVGNAGRI